MPKSCIPETEIVSKIFVRSVFAKKKYSDTHFIEICFNGILIISFQIKDSYDRPVYFYVHENDKQKCQWLKLVQAPLEGGVNNMVAYNSDLGVCYCAVKDINVGDEVLVVFQSDFGKSVFISEFLMLSCQIFFVTKIVEMKL